MKWSNFLVTAMFAALTFALWGWVNRPASEPPWPERVQGMAFSPFRAGQDPVHRTLPSVEQIDQDLALLAGKVNAVRTYSSLDSLAEVPRLAARHRIKVTVGTWLAWDRDTNRREIDNAITLAQAHPNVIRLLIGNEALLRKDLTLPQLITHLDEVRAKVHQPVSTAEPWHIWLSNPQLADHVDFLAVHLLPYWEGVPASAAVDYVDERMRELRRAFPGKPIVIAEVGWPSDGRTREAAVASLSNEAMFLRRFLLRARQEGYVYYLMEAFDQPWKSRYEGAVGAYWGIYDVQRRAKFAFDEPVVRIPQWQTLAGV